MRACDIENRRVIMSTLNDEKIKGYLYREYGVETTSIPRNNELRIHFKSVRRNSEPYTAAKQVKSLFKPLGNVWENIKSNLYGSELVLVFNKRNSEEISHNLSKLKGGKERWMQRHDLDEDAKLEAYEALEEFRSKNIPDALMSMRQGNQYFANGEVFPTYEDAMNELEREDELNTQRDFTQDKQFQKLSAEEKAKTIEQVTKEHRSITALKDLAHKLAYRIGGKVEFVNRTNVDWKAYNQGMKSVLNEAYMTPDTPFHEILAHPIIRAIKGNQKVDEKAFDILPSDEVFGYENRDGFVVVNYNNNTSFDTFYKTKEEAKNAIPNIKARLEQTSQLYQSLLKELETGRGKEIFEQVKKDYKYKEIQIYPVEDRNLYERVKEFFIDKGRSFERDVIDNKKVFDFEGKKYRLLHTDTGNLNLYRQDEYTLEEQQEEALVTLLGLLAADKLDATKDATLISKLKEFWKQISDFVKSLLRQDGIKIDELPITTTLNDLAEIMAYGNNKIILPGYKIEYSTPLGNKYDTLEEVNNEIRGLADSNVEVDLSGVRLKYADDISQVPDKFSGYAVTDEISGDGYEVDIFKNEEGVFKQIHPYTGEELDISDQQVLLYYNNLIGIKSFIEKNKEYEQSREIIEQWKKENNIQYDPEEVYSRGQEFYHIHNAYSRNNVDTELWIQNLLETIQDKAKIGAKVEMSFATAPKGEVGKGLQHKNKKTRQTVYITAYPKSEDIEFVSQIDNYTSSFTDLTVDMIKSFTNQKNERVGIALTKSVPLRNLHTIQPNLATTIDNVAHHNEIVLGLTPYNFRINYEENVPYHLKNLIDKFNKILDDKYGKLIKPEIKKQGEKIVQYGLYSKGANDILDWFDTKEEAQAKVDESNKQLTDLGESPDYSVRPITKPIGKQPTQTKENTTSIESVKNKLDDGTFGIKSLTARLKYEQNKIKILQANIDTNSNVEESKKAIEETKKEISRLEDLIKNPPQKEYNQQALVNLKIAALKEVARKYPRSLITSKVIPIDPNLIDNSEIQYSKVGSKQDVEGFENRINNQTSPKTFSPNYLFTKDWNIKVPEVILETNDSNSDFNLSCIKK